MLSWAALVAVQFGIKLISYPLLHTIWSYLSRKAPAMQTLKDKMIKDLILWMVAQRTVGFFGAFFKGNVPKFLAKYAIGTSLILTHGFLSQSLMTIFVTYLLVFNGKPKLETMILIVASID